MSTLLTELGLYTYESYLKAFETWVQNKQSSKPSASEALIEFTRLNLARTHRLHKTIELDPVLKRAVINIEHTHTWIVLTEAWCGDSAQNLPIIAELEKLNPEKIKLYIVLRDENPHLMNNYLTNGAKSIPKLIAFDNTLGKVVFTWGPRPGPVQAMLYAWKKNQGGKTWNDFEKELHSWYAKDKTETVQAEFLNIFIGRHNYLKRTVSELTSFRLNRKDVCKTNFNNR